MITKKASHTYSMTVVDHFWKISGWLFVFLFCTTLADLSLGLDLNSILIFRNRS